jgi:hypothetical protein
MCSRTRDAYGMPNLQIETRRGNADLFWICKVADWVSAAVGMYVCITCRQTPMRKSDGMPFPSRRHALPSSHLDIGGPTHYLGSKEADGIVVLD